MSNHSALWLDHKEQTVKLVQYNGTLEQLYEYTACNCVEIVRLNKDHVMFVDEEGLFKDYSVGFAVAIGNKKPVEIFGSALITGDNYGEPQGLNFDFREINIELICYAEPREAKEEEGV